MGSLVGCRGGLQRRSGVGVHDESFHTRSELLHCGFGFMFWVTGLWGGGIGSCHVRFWPFWPKNVFFVVHRRHARFRDFSFRPKVLYFVLLFFVFWV